MKVGVTLCQHSKTDFIECRHIAASVFKLQRTGRYLTTNSEIYRQAVMIEMVNSDNCGFVGTGRNYRYFMSEVSMFRK